MSFSAKIVLDSISPYTGIRLVTSELTYPRFIHSEVMTHRMFSRNAASSRAIPNSQMIDMVANKPAMPVYWGKSKRGMSASKEIENVDLARDTWLNAKDEMVKYAESFRDIKLHKQIANRILEPWKWMTIIVSATNLSNFFVLRDHQDAQPEIAHVAKLWRIALEDSQPISRQWHIPYIQNDEEGLDLELKKKVGVARCARVSYLTHSGVRSIDKDIELYNRLLGGSGHGHWSPFEHVAEATDMKAPYYNFAKKEFEVQPIWCGNFQGWIQHRKVHNGECQ